MFGLLKKKAEDAAKKFSGRTDFLEAVCAGVALVASADGELEDSEIAAAMVAVNANKALSANFPTSQIEQTMEGMFTRAKGGRIGRAGLWTEIEEIAKDPEMSTAVVLTALDVAEADGEVEPEEKKVLETLASRLKVNLGALMAA